MRRLVLSLVVISIITAAPVGAQEIAHSQFFPVIARTSGIGGTQWLSDMTVVNLTDAQLDCGMQFLVAGQPNVFDPTFPTRIALAPHETRLIEDILGTIFNYTSDIKGSLLLTVDPTLIPGNPVGSVILATTRTYNTGSPDGTFGQTVPAMGLSINAAASSSFATGARNDSRFRSNLGIVSLSLFSNLKINYRIMDSTGATVVEGAKTLEPASMNQWSFPQLGVPTMDGPLTVELWMDPDEVYPDPCASFSANMFIAYVSKVDGNPDGTGDAEFIYAAPMEPYDCER